MKREPHRYGKFFLGPGCCLMAACSPSGTTSDSIDLTVDTRPSVMAFDLSPKELAGHSKAAIAGSVLSGHCVALYYWYVDIDEPNRNYWLQIAAENGDSEAMGLLAFVLEKGSRPTDVDRAAFWGRRASETTRLTDVNCRLK